MNRDDLRVFRERGKGVSHGLRPRFASGGETEDFQRLGKMLAQRFDELVPFGLRHRHHCVSGADARKQCAQRVEEDRFTVQLGEELVAVSEAARGAARREYKGKVGNPADFLLQERKDFLHVSRSDDCDEIVFPQQGEDLIRHRLP